MEHLSPRVALSTSAREPQLLKPLCRIDNGSIRYSNADHDRFVLLLFGRPRTPTVYLNPNPLTLTSHLEPICRIHPWKAHVKPSCCDSKTKP